MDDCLTRWRNFAVQYSEFDSPGFAGPGSDVLPCFIDLVLETEVRLFKLFHSQLIKLLHFVYLIPVNENNCRLETRDSVKKVLPWHHGRGGDSCFHSDLHSFFT